MTHSPMSQNRELIVELTGVWGGLTALGHQVSADIVDKAISALTAPPASDAAGAEGERERIAALVRSAMFADRDIQWMPFSERVRAMATTSEEVADQILAAAPTATAQAPSRPVDAGGVEAACIAFYGSEEEWRARQAGASAKQNSLFRERMKSALATQAPDKAEAREGVESAIIDSMVHLQCALGWPPEEAHRAINEALANLSSALATQPTGTEASRPVGGEAQAVLAAALKVKYPPSDLELDRLSEAVEAYRASTQTPDKEVPREGVEDLLAGATEGEWVVGDTPGSICTIRGGNFEEHAQALPWDARLIVRLVRDARATPPTPPQAYSTGQGDGWSDLSPAEIVRRTRCEADTYDGKDDGFTTRAAIWRQCCDAILSKLATPSQADAQTQEGGR